MSALEELLSNRWIIKSENKERYYRIKDSLEDVRKYVTEKMGCQLISNSLLIKLEKIPAKAENYMGIDGFSDKMEYCFLCIVLMFLEDKEAEEQFVLSQLTEYIAANMIQEKIDWTIYTFRRQLIKVIRFCVESGILRINDGNEDTFANDGQGDVLYENTGVSKYFMRNFSRDILAYREVKDFENSDWIEVNEDRGIARRHRVYKRILFSMGVYRAEKEDEDFEYLKYYGGRIQEDILKNLDCRLLIHRNSAYLIMGEDSKMGNAFPGNHTLSDIVLLCNRFIVTEIKENRLNVEWDETVKMDKTALERLLRNCKEQYGQGFAKTYREKTSAEFIKIVSDYMEQLDFIALNESTHEVTIKPIVGKVVGVYSKEWEEKRVEINE